MRFALFFLSCALLADSKYEADLERRLSASETARTELIRANADLSRRLGISQAISRALVKAASELAAVNSAQLKKTHAEEKGAVAQAQDESTQTLANTDASVRAETEFEKQLARIEKNLIKLMWGMIGLIVLMLCFVGVIIYAPRRRDRVPALPIQVGEQ